MTLITEKPPGGRLTSLTVQMWFIPGRLQAARGLSVLWPQAAVQAHAAALLPAQVGGPSRPPGVALPLGDPKHPTELEGTVLGNQLAGGRA